jgi:hypothetical protein
MQRSDSYYSVYEAAKILKLTPGRIRQMLRAGELEGVPPEEGGGYGEGLVLSPPAGFYADLTPCVSFLLFRRGLLSSPGARMASSKSLRLSPEGVLC